MAALIVRRAGPACTIQDGGRRGWLRFGVTSAGPMDWISHREANRLAGNEPEDAALEIGPGGLDCEAAESSVRIGISGPGFEIWRGGQALPQRVAMTLMRGERLSLKPGRRGLWAYISVAGGLCIGPVLGSLSTHLRSGLGPLGGTALTAGTRVPARQLGRDIDLPDLGVPGEPGRTADVVRIVPGPQDDYFSADALKALFTTPYRVSSRADRMGYCLEGAPLAHRDGHDIVSDGIAHGAIQVPGNGQPIVLMADRQPTGGYPKIGTVIRADLPLLAQKRPGESIRFAALDVNGAVDALRQAAAAADDIVGGCRPLPRGLDAELLASGNFASGFVNARDC